jgi:hypothetical protein
MQKFIFFFPILFFLKIIKSQLIISISPYQSKLKKLFNHYFDFFENYAVELEDIEVKNQSIHFDNMILKKKENLNPYLKSINESYNFMIFAPFPFKLEGNYSFYKNSIEKRGKIIISIYYIYAKQIIKDNKYDFDIIIKEKKSDVESNYKIFLEQFDYPTKTEILKLLQDNFLKKNMINLQNLVKSFLMKAMEKEYENKYVPMTLSSIFGKKKLRFNMSFVKFPEFYKNISILTYYSGNIKDEIQRNITLDNDEFKNFFTDEENKKKYFINYELLRQIIDKSEYQKNNIILSIDNPLKLSTYFFAMKNWKNLITKTTDSKTVKLILNIKNITNFSKTKLETELNLKINHETNEETFAEFNIKVSFFLEANLKYTSTINICANDPNIEDVDDEEKEDEVKEKVNKILKTELNNICLFEKGINLFDELIYVDDYYLDETGIYLIGEDNK